MTSLQTMIERVKANNPSLENTQVVVIDKYFAEVQAIKLVVLQIQLCLFHVLKAIRKEILKSVPKKSHRQVYSLVHSLVLGLCSIAIMIAIYRRVVPAIVVDH